MSPDPTSASRFGRPDLDPPPTGAFRRGSRHRPTPLGPGRAHLPVSLAPPECTYTIVGCDEPVKWFPDRRAWRDPTGSLV